jgi:collagen type I/II/III/V/XI/XXIV/XXVII alpha
LVAYSATAAGATISDTLTFGAVPAGATATIYLTSLASISDQYALLNEGLAVGGTGLGTGYGVTQQEGSVTATPGQTEIITTTPTSTTPTDETGWAGVLTVTFPVVTDGVYTVTENCGAQAGDSSGNSPLVPGTVAAIDPGWSIASPGSYTTASGVQLSVACYCAGTRILTLRGEVEVEHLAVGDVVLTTAGSARPVRWIGHRRVDCRHHPRPDLVWPVRVRAGAFADGSPRRDLLLSPDHALLLDVGGAACVLIPVKYLINGGAIAQERVAAVHYYHVELDRHDIVLAEGLPAESYLDTGNRAAFANAPAFGNVTATNARPRTPAPAGRRPTGTPRSSSPTGTAATASRRRRRAAAPLPGAG